MKRVVVRCLRHAAHRSTATWPRRRDIAANARDKAKEAEAEARLAAGGPATIAAVIPVIETATANRTVLEPAATRPCPHCGEAITIVALLTTPEAARPSLPNTVSEVVSLRRA